MTSKKKRLQQPVSKEGRQNIIDFAKTLKKIHIRLIAEGYVIKEGNIYKPDRKE